MKRYEICFAAGRLEARKTYKAANFEEAYEKAKADRAEMAASLASLGETRITLVKEAK